MTIEQLENGYTEISFRSMNSTVSVTLPAEIPEAQSLIENVVQPFFVEFEQQCSRFIAGNPLDCLNQRPSEPALVPEWLFTALGAAYESYLLTDGAFDPRILRELKAAGYEHSFNPDERAPGFSSDLTPLPRTEWQPTLEALGDGGRVSLGGVAVDLGGIGKGLAVDLISEKLRRVAPSGLVNAGGDLQAWGVNPEGQAWRVGVENPLDPSDTEPVAVLALNNIGLATSSVRRRKWQGEDGMTTHHLINPSTGQSTDTTLQSVTVLHPNTRTAETITKALFVAGAANALEKVESFDVPAFWVTADEAQHATPSMRDALIWVSRP